MTAALIMIANHRFTVDSLNRIIERHRVHELKPQIIVSYVGTPPTGIEADLVVNVQSSRMTLAQPRNQAARSTTADWLIFTDADTYYTKELSGLLDTEHQVFRGDKRADTDDFNQRIGHEYTVVAAPMAIRRSLFEEVGGYHEGYFNYGHEDADFLHKFDDCPLVNAGAIHVMSIHLRLAGDDWERSKNANDQLYRTRMTMPKDDRIAHDRLIYFS